MTTDRAAELREAFERSLAGHDHDGEIIDEAIATIALPILEADPELVERLHNVVHSWVPEFNWPAVEQMTLEILAAISTPTPPQTFTDGDCPENYWSPELGPCICRGRVHGPAISTPTPLPGNDS